MKKFLSIMLVIVLAFSFVTIASARLVGDVNSDGKANSSDALEILRFAVGLTDEINKTYADINADSVINSSDALLVLNIAVGKYEGDLEVEDQLVTSYKKDTIDPIMKTGNFTLKTQMDADGVTANVTTMVKGNDVCVETAMEGITARVLILGNKTYLVMPDFIMPGVGVYMEYQEQLKPNTDGAADAQYVKSEYVTVDGEKLVCETYKLADGSQSQYYFKDGKWVMLAVQQDGEFVSQKVVEFKSGVKNSYFSLDGFIKLDLEDK
ncbi:MAG: dockerin type I domain-containing protein [Acutalibacteraceae bacterium]|nr:dockerin type I domain-containing protein [Acutalibacteraceae bacterium]